MTTQNKQTSVMFRAVALIGVYALATLLGSAMFIGLMHGAVAILGQGVMFYRGVGALMIVFLALLIVLVLALPRMPRFGLDAADALGAATVSTCLLLAVFIVGPITVDRSVSVFMLSQFEAADGPLTPQQTRDAFVRIYVDDWAQIERRLKEQQVSGNLEPTPDGWRLTARGRAFMNTARAMSSVFGGDPRFVGRKD